MIMNNICLLQMISRLQPNILLVIITTVFVTIATQSKYFFKMISVMAKRYMLGF